jgi:hypothetical protein
MSGNRVGIIMSQRYGRIEFTYSVEDTELILSTKWYANMAGSGKMYIKTFIKGEPKQLSRLLLNVTDSIVFVDHVDGDTLNNTRQNLRSCSRYENSRNRNRHVNNKSGYKGVCWHKQRQKWQAEIQHDNKQVHLGAFSNKQDAIDAYAAAAKKYHKEFAKVK